MIDRIAAVVSRIIYTVVALTGLWRISMLFRDRDDEIEHVSSRN